MAATPTIDQAKLDAFMGQFVNDLGAAATAPLVVLGDKLGLYKAMAGGAPVTPGELAERTGCRERYVREWLCQQAASGYVEYARGSTFRLPPEQGSRWPSRTARRSSPGGIPARRRDDQGRAAHRASASSPGRACRGAITIMTCSRARSASSAPAISANLAEAWLPALDDVVEKLRAGARVADIGCGHGASTILMAEAFPASRFRGLRTTTPASIDRGADRGRARRRDGPRRVRGRAARRTSPAGRYDLVCVFDCPPRHGRPRWRRAPRPLPARRRRDLDDRRALRGRRARGQPEAGRA